MSRLSRSVAVSHIILIKLNDTLTKGAQSARSTRTAPNEIRFLFLMVVVHCMNDLWYYVMKVLTLLYNIYPPVLLTTYVYDHILSR